VKQDGFRLIVSRDGDRVRLFTRNGYDWTSRYPLIVEAARRIRTKQFVLDGEAVLLGVDGISDFAGLYNGKHNDEIQLYAFDNRQFGVLVTTSVVARQAYEEVREDRHPIVFLSGKDIADILLNNGFSTPAAVRALIDAEFSLTPSTAVS